MNDLSKHDWWFKLIELFDQYGFAALVAGVSLLFLGWLVRKIIDTLDKRCKSTEETNRRLIENHVDEREKTINAFREDLKEGRELQERQTERMANAFDELTKAIREKTV